MAGEYWHHLQLEDKLFDYWKFGCYLCKKPVLGSRGYECGECRGFFLHESCPEPTDKTSHDLRYHTHHLISMKEVDNNGENKVVCSLCEEPVSGLLGNNGPTIYKCSIPNCSFLLLHEPCAQLPYKITTHPLHFLPNHDLYLEWVTESNSREFCCHACCEVLSKGVFYGCVKCDDYNLHFRCASRWLNISTADNCNRHAFIPIRDPFEFTCKACGVKDSHFACLCSNCRLLIHINCGKFLGTIKIRGHDHSLTCTFSLTSKGKKHECEVCNKEVDTNHAAYCCDDHKCDYIAHLRCAYWLRKDVSETSTTVSDEYATHLVEGSDLKEDEKIGTQEIQHPSHPQHKLILKNEELQDVKLCKGCMQFITLLPFYGCEEECSFSLHIRCAKLPQEVRRLKHHQHPLTLHYNVDSNIVLSFNCWACWRFRNGFSYRCVKDSCKNKIFDAQCILIPEVFKHEGHRHSLFLDIFNELEPFKDISIVSNICINSRGIRNPRECNACGKRPNLAHTFNCTTCEFHLCIKCATLPLVARHRYDTHLLHLTYAAAEDNTEEYYCEICEKVMNEKRWFYYCKDCDVAAHPQCILRKTWLK